MVTDVRRGDTARFSGCGTRPDPAGTGVACRAYAIAGAAVMQQTSSCRIQSTSADINAGKPRSGTKDPDSRIERCAILRGSFATLDPASAESANFRREFHPSPAAARPHRCTANSPARGNPRGSPPSPLFPLAPPRPADRYRRGS